MRIRDTDVACAFQAAIVGEFAPLTDLKADDIDINTMNTTAYRNTAMPDVLDLCDDRRGLKNRQYKAEGEKAYREANKRLLRVVKKAKEDWIGIKCEVIETCLIKNNSKRAYKLVKNLILEKQGRSTIIQDKSGKYLTEEQEILSRWTEYCSELHNYDSYDDNASNAIGP